MNGRYLSEIIDINDIESGRLNLIKAGCGAGKTHFALETLKNAVYANSTMVYLIDTTKGKKQLLKRKNVVVFDEQEWMDRAAVWEREVADYNKVVVMTYYHFGLLCAKYSEFSESIDVLVCDEIHNLISFNEWERKKEQDESKRYYQKALGVIQNIICLSKADVVAMTATPSKVEDVFDNIYYIKMDGEPRHYENGTEEIYNNLTLLLNKISAGKKGLVYVPRITQMQKYMQVLREKGIKTEAIWSEHNKEHQMSSEQLEINNSVVNDAMIPDDVDVLFINKSCETSVNIKSHLDFVIVHSSDVNVQIQARGRYRSDLDELYVLDSDVIDEIVLPERMLNKRLTKADIDDYIAENDFRGSNRHVMKQPTFLKWVEDCGYRVEKKRTKTERYLIISE